MALATRCPKCQSMFRVVADQLKLRGGLVRCGSCRHVFDAIGSLAYVDDNSVSPTVPFSKPRDRHAPPTLRIEPGSLLSPSPKLEGDGPAPRKPIEAGLGESGVPTLLITDLPQEPEVTGKATVQDKVGHFPATQTAKAVSETAAGGAASEAAPVKDPIKTAEDEAASAERRERRRRRKAEEQARQAAAAEATDDEEAPSFLQGEQRSRGFSVVFGGGSVLLALLLVAQLAVVFRIELTTRFPNLRPTLVELCRPFGCTVGWPTRAELLAVVGTELQAVPGTDILELTAVVRNRASFRVALPAIEVTLTDTQNRPLARKVFAPVDYLASNGEPSSRIDEGLAASGDYVVRINFEARGLNAAGFVVYPFYL